MSQKENPTSRDASGDSLEQLLKINDATSLAGLSDGVQAGYVFSPDEWKADAEATITALAGTGEVFTVDDIRRHGAQDPDIPQRWGSLLAAAQNRGTIRLVGLSLHRTTGGASIGIREWQGAANPSEGGGN